MTTHPLGTLDGATQTIIAALLKLQHPQTIEEVIQSNRMFPTVLDDQGESWSQCHFTGCDEVAFFPNGNGGICHTSECAMTIAARLAHHQGEPNFFDRLALKSLIHQVANIERYPQKRHPKRPDVWIHFCPFCSALEYSSKTKNEDGSTTITVTMPHAPECIVTRAKASENGGAR